MGNPWLDHVKEVKKNNPKLMFKEILLLAKKTYSSTVNKVEKGVKNVVKSAKKMSRKLRNAPKKSRKRRKSRRSRKSRRRN